jgi:hypothetical protein
MGIASYNIVRSKDGWAAEHEGKVGGDYATKEIAFEIAVGAASNAIKEGHEIRIVVPGSGGDMPALGAP